MVKKVNWCPRQVPTECSNKVNQSLFYPDKSVFHLGSNLDGNNGDYDEDAITWVLKENNRKSSDGKIMKDATDGKDDNESEDEIEYTIRKTCIHITHKIKKVQKKADEFQETNAEDLSLKSVSDTDSDTQLQSQKQVSQEILKSPRQTLKLRTILVSNLKTERDLTGNNTIMTLLLRGFHPKRLNINLKRPFH